MTRRIRKNSREYRNALENATNITCHHVGNYFLGERCPDGSWLVDEAASMRRSKLTETDGRYQLKLHGNLWYRFDAGA